MRRIAPLILIWFIAVGAGLCWMNQYGSTPSEKGKPPTTWPKDSHPSIGEKTAGNAILVMFAHPKCPCTRASIAELSHVMARCDEALDAYVVLVKPPAVDDEWVETDLQQSALRIPGVIVLVDEGGQMARRFQSVTSGETLVYDKKATLRFHGGITVSRGHHGQSAGRAFIVDLLSGDSTDAFTSHSDSDLVHIARNALAANAPITARIAPSESDWQRLASTTCEPSGFPIYETPVFGCALLNQPYDQPNE